MNILSIETSCDETAVAVLKIKGQKYTVLAKKKAKEMISRDDSFRVVNIGKNLNDGRFNLSTDTKKVKYSNAFEIDGTVLSFGFFVKKSRVKKVKAFVPFYLCY